MVGAGAGTALAGGARYLRRPRRARGRRPERRGCGGAGEELEAGCEAARRRPPSEVERRRRGGPRARVAEGGRRGGGARGRRRRRRSSREARRRRGEIRQPGGVKSIRVGLQCRGWTLRPRRGGYILHPLLSRVVARPATKGPPFIAGCSTTRDKRVGLLSRVEPPPATKGGWG